MSISFCCTDDFTSNNISMCISYEGNVYSFGKSDFGAHGHEEKQINIPKQISGLSGIKMISCGMSHSCCIDYNGNLYSFGRNSCGQLGINNPELSLTNIPQKVNLPFIQQVSCGNDFTICKSDNHCLYSFGYNSFGQLGVGNKINYYSPQQIPDLYKVELIECGGNHAICKTYDGICYVWGNNSYGQLGKDCVDIFTKPTECNNWPDNIKSIKIGYNFSLILTEKGDVYACGTNNYGELGINDLTSEKLFKLILIKDLPEIQRIEGGYNHSMCIDTNNNLWIFGYNNHGELGLGDKKNRIYPIKLPILVDIIDISSGGYHTFIKTSDNNIYAFGKNENQQLGIKTKEHCQLTPIQVLEGNEDIWCSTIGKSKAKSARK